MWRALQRYHQGLLIHASDRIGLIVIVIAIILFATLNICHIFPDLTSVRGDKIRVKGGWWVLSANFTPGWFGIGIRYCPAGDQFIDILPILSAWPWDSSLEPGGKVPFASSFLQIKWSIHFCRFTPSSSIVTIDPAESCASQPFNCDKANWNPEKMHSNFGLAAFWECDPYMGWDQHLLNNSNRLCVVWL